MKLKVLTTSDRTDHPGWLKLKASLEKFNYDYEHIKRPFQFGHQLPIIRDWCNNYNGDCTHILYTDCFDTIAFAGPDEVINKFPNFKRMLISGEKACYPHPERAKDYPEMLHPWKFVNGGGWMVEIQYFKELTVKENLTLQSHDQVWLMEAFLRNQDDIWIDNECHIFQPIAHSHQWEWIKQGNRWANRAIGSFPIFFHGNGRTEMNWLYED